MTARTIIRTKFLLASITFLLFVLVIEGILLIQGQRAMAGECNTANPIPPRGEVAGYVAPERYPCSLSDVASELKLLRADLDQLRYTVNQMPGTCVSEQTSGDCTFRDIIDKVGSLEFEIERLRDGCIFDGCSLGDLIDEIDQVQVKLQELHDLWRDFMYTPVLE